MNRKILVVLTLSTFLWSADAQENSPLKTEKDKASYSIGWNFGSSLKQSDVDVELDLFMKGIKDALSGSKGLLNQQEVREALNAVQNDIRTKRQAKGEQNLKASQAFLDQNKTKPGIHALPDGLQYKIITEGSGASPKSNDTVSVNYRGTLLDGTEFDSSYKEGKPRKFPVNMVIRGWSEALQLMKPGAKWQLFIPPALAYQQLGRPGIPPNALLIFDVEMVSVTPAPPPITLTNPPPVTSDIIKVPSAEGIKRGEKIEVLKPEDVEKEKRKK